MSRAKIVLGAAVVAFVFAAALGLGWLLLQRSGEAVTVVSPPDPSTAAPSDAGPPPEASRGFLYGRVTGADGTVYEGRLRFGGDEEAFWDDAFNGYKAENPWAMRVGPERLTEEQPVEIFGVHLATREVQVDLERPFLARFGDIARIDTGSDGLRVTLKNGSVFDLDRFNADDVADGLRVWDDEHGVVDLAERGIRAIDFLPTPPLGDPPARLHGTVRTSRGTFTGFVQWDMVECMGSDELVGVSDGGEVRFPFGEIASIERMSADSARVTLDDGREVVMAGTRKVTGANRGVSVEDPRFGRVLIRWNAFERVDFEPSRSSGPGYDDFPAGSDLAGRVTTRDGRRLTGRLVYDLDESLSTDTLDAPDGGVSYTIPFDLVASIEPSAGAGETIRVTLRGGEALRLDPRGDLGEGNAGMLVFEAGGGDPVYVPWKEIARIELDRL